MAVISDFSRKMNWNKTLVKAIAVAQAGERKGLKYGQGSRNEEY